MPDRTSYFLVEPEQLRTLLTLAECRTFSAAAAGLGVQQSAISHQIRRIEERLGRKLFRRTGAGVELTADGEALAIYGRAMLKVDATMRQHFQEPHAAVTLRIGIVEELNRTALPTVLWLFSQEFPSFEFKVASGRPGDLVREVREGRLEAAIIRHRGDMAGAEQVWADRLVWVGRSDMHMPVSDPVPLVLPPDPSTLRELVLGSLQEAGRTWRVPFEGVSLASLEAGLRAGLGVGAFTASMELFGVVALGESAGLPKLPEMRFSLLQGPAPLSDAVAAFCNVFRDAARLCFRIDKPFSS